PPMSSLTQPESGAPTPSASNRTIGNVARVVTSADLPCRYFMFRAFLDVVPGGPPLGRAERLGTALGIHGASLLTDAYLACKTNSTGRAVGWAARRARNVAKQTLVSAARVPPGK